ncbi:hypothetical protein BDZ94DRAFT_1286061 [Collybia nuda]|uniref:Uncharacterized protein n=1 Tax=Collybia nuda TaxID=64659 RepID=A0A9P5XTX4_9AGAR|nr:hypothetical protein BDZ94DRAFT_1286061 [Collybia nuda]
MLEKYYSKYGKRALTGGIMAIWYTHGVSYGFHCIPRGKGRNDVFSALWTHWPKASEVVVYDFACALGHKSCSRACALGTYGVVDPHISELNTSVAKSGNGGLSRIRKSVSYMSQERAIVYTKTFIGIWNRMRIRDMLPTS